MHEWLGTHKPFASRQTHLLLAALMGSVVGTSLLIAGTRWMWHGRASSVVLGAALATAVVLGFLKARFVLDPAAGGIIERIRSRGDGCCLGGFLSLRSWGLVLLMVAAGRLLRATPIPIAMVGFVYAIIGTALVVASRRLWCALLS